MRYYLSDGCALKSLETPCVYSISKDELYELDDDAFGFLTKCASTDGCEDVRSDFVDYCIKEEILRTDSVVCTRPPLEKQAAPTLRYLELQITRRCNLKCRHCYLGPPETTELSTKDIVRVLDEFQRMQGIRVLITGGEPVLHSDFGKINRILPEYAMRKVLFTNGTLLNIDLIRNLNVDEIQISLDGLQEAHESLRGPRTFDRAIRCIRDAIDSGLQASVSTMIHRNNLNDLEEMEAMLSGMRIKDWTVDVPCSIGNFENNKEFRIEPNEAGRFLAYGFGAGLHGAGTYMKACPSAGGGSGPSRSMNWTATATLSAPAEEDAASGQSLSAPDQEKTFTNALNMIHF
jgi:sulfatase maturation enzyme AslB (radical SAM superfamily)